MAPGLDCHVTCAKLWPQLLLTITSVGTHGTEGGIMIFFFRVPKNKDQENGTLTQTSDMQHAININKSKMQTAFLR